MNPYDAAEAGSIITGAVFKGTLWLVRYDFQGSTM